MSVIFKRKLWDKAARTDLYSKALYAVGNEAVKDIQANIDASIPAGRVYRRSRITRVASKRNAVKGLRLTEKQGKQARIVGYNFHRASAKGQPPAKDTKRLYRGNRVMRLSAFGIRVYNIMPYARHLEPPAKLNRPFFASAVNKNRDKYRRMIMKAVGEELI